MTTEEKIKAYEAKHGPGSYERMRKRSDRQESMKMLGWGILFVIFFVVVILVVIYANTYDI